MKCIDIIKKYYNDKEDQKPLFDFSKFNINHITTNNLGLGDNLLLTCVSNKNQRKVHSFSNSKHWNTLCKFNNELDSKILNYVDYFPIENFGEMGSGNGHIIQGVQRALNLNVEIKPKGYLFVDENQKNIKPYLKIGICLSTNNSGSFLIDKGFKNPRTLNENTLSIINKFINCTKHEFIQFGDIDILKNNNVRNKVNYSIEESIKELSTCDYYIGLNSGFMHIAAALDIKSIILVNVPDPIDLYLPILKNVAVYDLNWLYPQNVHLHEYGENDIVKQINFDNLLRAIDGELYPFWKNDCLNLINE